MTKRALGYTYKHALKREIVPGTSPGGNFNKVPVYDANLGPAQKKQVDTRAGQGRDPEFVYADVIDVKGTVKVPVDPRYIGFWLTGLLGDAVVTGGGPYTHSFASGGVSLPSYTHESQHANPASFDLSEGVYVDSMQFIQPSTGGPAMATVSLIGMNWVPNTVTQAGVLVAQTEAFIGNLQGSLTLGGVATTDVTSFDFTYSNNLVSDRDTNSAGLISRIDPGAASVSGKVSTRFIDTSWRDIAWNNTPAALALAYTINANLKLTLTLPHVLLEPAAAAVSGPGGYGLDLNFVGQLDSIAGNMFSAVLINDLAGAVYS